MKIAWVTPLSRKSGISKYSLAVVPQLASLADVDVWAPPTGDDYEVPRVAMRPLKADRGTMQRLSTYDAVVFNAGNNPSFHAEIQALSEKVGGIVVVHDKRMHGFFFELWSVLGRDPGRYAAMMRYYYGVEGERFATQVLSSRANVDSDSRFPLIGPAICNAQAIIVHSAEAVSLVSRYDGLVPVVALGLPFDLSCVRDSSTLPGRERLAPGVGERVLAVSNGGVFEQKRLESIIRALAARPALHDCVHLAIVGGGRAEYVRRLQALAEELGIAELVTITGYVDDATMYGWLAAADFALNLRYPSMESGSLTLIEQMLSGLPVIVSDTSYYSELPGDVAIKVPVDSGEVDAIGNALETLVADSGRRHEMGRAAAAFALRAHDPRAYAREVLTLAEQVASAKKVTR